MAEEIIEKTMRALTKPVTDTQVLAAVAEIYAVTLDDLLADNGFETDDTRTQSPTQWLAHLLCIADDIGAERFGAMLDRFEAHADAEPAQRAAPLAGLEVRELTAAEAAEAFGGPELARYTCLPRIPGWSMDPRARIPAQFAPVYVLARGVQS